MWWLNLKVKEEKEELPNYRIKKCEYPSGKVEYYVQFRFMDEKYGTYKDSFKSLQLAKDYMDRLIDIDNVIDTYIKYP